MIDEDWNQLRESGLKTIWRWGCNYYSCCVIIIMQADCLLGLRDKPPIGRSDRLLTWCLYGCGREEPARKRLVFNSRCKATSLQLKLWTHVIIHLNSEHIRYQLHLELTQSVHSTHKHSWQVVKKWIIQFTFLWKWNDVFEVSLECDCRCGCQTLSLGSWT